MEDFRVPEDFSNLSALQKKTNGRFCASADVPDLRPLCENTNTHSDLNDRLDALASDLGVADEPGFAGADNVDSLAEQENFDNMFAFVR